MVYALSTRLSWICLLLFSSASCFPKPGVSPDNSYPATWSSGTGAAPGSSFPSAPAVNYQQPPQEPSAPTGNQSPSGVGAHTVLAVSPPRWAPGSSGSGSGKPVSAPEVPSLGAVYVSPPRPASTGGFSVQSQPAGTSGHSSGGSGGVAFSPVYRQPSTGYMASASSYGAGSVNSPPATFYGAGSFGASVNTAPAIYYPADTGRPASYSSYDAAPEASSGAGAGFGSSPGLPWVVEPVEASFSDPNEWMPRGEFPDFSVWQSGGSSSKMSRSEAETSPVPSSTYIIQTGNGYMRARQFQSHTNYAPEEAEPMLFVAEPVRVPTKTRPAAPKGGKKF